MILFDSHSHLHSFQFDGDREEIIKKLRDFDIKTINIGTDFEESKKAVELARKYPDLLHASVGLHPTDNSKEDLDINIYRELAKDEKVVAIGECGLDYAFFAHKRSEWLQKRASTEAFGEGGLSEKDIKEKQKMVFIKQAELSKELEKPLILHCRPSRGTQDAYEDIINIIENLKFKIKNYNNGVVHFFSGSKETAKKFLDFGFYISFAGPITFAPEYREVVEFISLDKILIETDSPFAAPLPYRGQRNEPTYIEFVARQIAEWKGLDFDKVAAQTHNNAKDLFRI